MVSAATAADEMVLHAVWSDGALRLWAESRTAWRAARDAEQPTPAEGEIALHPFAVDPPAELLGEWAGEPVRVKLKLPAIQGAPLPSSGLAAALGLTPPDPEAVVFKAFEVPAVSIAPLNLLDHADELQERLAPSDTAISVRPMQPGASVEFYLLLVRFAQHLLTQQRFVPMLKQDGAGKLSGGWHPWLGDEATAARVTAMVAAMPPAARSAIDDLGHDPWHVIERTLADLINAACRRTLLRETMTDTVEDLDPSADPQVAWLHGLLGEPEQVPAPMPQRTEIARRVRRWIGGLEERGQSSAWRLCFRVNEPLSEDLPADLDDASETVGWSISFFLRSQDDPDVVVEAADVWLLSRESVTIQGYALESPQELLLGELGRASRYFRKLEAALNESEPFEIALSTGEAYEFLREVRPILVEQGFGVESPPWWDSPSGRLGARMRIDSDPMEALLDQSGGTTSAASPQLGLGTLVSYHWEIAIGDTTLTLHEFEQFASKSSPLVRIGGKWVEIRPEDVQNAIKFIRENPGGKIELAEAMRLAYASDLRQTGVPVLGMDATGWVAELFGGTGKIELPLLETPQAFKGTLRPYQLRGLSWMSFMERFGFGACLADDMGLGKTIQLIALLVHEREAAQRAIEAGELTPEQAVVHPTLLTVPMSVVGNWMHETKRFAPQLRVMVHHGPDRLTDDAFVAEAEQSDIVVTTYALAHRDRETLERVRWGRLVLDEAQFVKNPAAKQAQAVRAISAARRVALTGTPVENRLSELWSIMDFLNPGYLGTAGQFRKRFSVPIERYRDPQRGAQLRGLVQPFILRRVKTDPTVVADLPEKLESREFCHLTSEQAQLYESCVKRMLTEVERSEGIHRRGLVLAALIKLKQICNHPSQMLRDHDPASGTPVDPTRSGKCQRILEMLDEALSEGDQALVFTQFRQMGQMLASMFRHHLGRDILLLHGGTAQGARQRMIDDFQAGKAPVLVLSLKAGGVGLNLTAATHVFHFDRWWNPAVENQATDRAYRIGQTRTVQVHKFVVRGTLEERIDEMIESKTELAENIIGDGERWLTELDTDQLRDILTLRAEAVGDDDQEE